MASFNREDSLRAADRALKANKPDAAIAEYVRVLEHQPRDTATANLLGDVYARAGQTDNAIGQYARIAEQFLADGFLPKASALFKKILKIRPEDEHSLLRLGQIAAKQGLLADARSFFTTVSAKRRARGDAQGADDVLIELADLDPADQDARIQAARIVAARGQGDAAASRLRELALDLLEKERADEAVDVLREAVHLVPSDRFTRKQLIGLLTDLGQSEEAEVYFTRDVLVDPGLFDSAVAYMRAMAPRNADAAAPIAEAVSEAALARRDVHRAVEALTAFLQSAPAQVASALRLVEICLEEGLDEMLPKAQRMLADAYEATGQHEAARQIEMDLAGGDPLAMPVAAPVEQPAVERAAAPVEEPAAAPSLTADVPDFDVYVYGQPIEPEAETEEQMIARLLAEEAARDSAASAEAMPEIDLTSSLDALDAPAAEEAAAPLEDVFEGFRERTRVEDADRAESAFEEAELAAALGQAGDAERLYTEAARALPFRFRAAAALGRLMLSQGRLADAIEWMERAAEAEAPDRDAAHALLYELGDALERHGESMRALVIFMELNAEAGDYRGIAARVERLARAGIGG